jgi:hypothetical protein
MSSRHNDSICSPPTLEPIETLGHAPVASYFVHTLVPKGQVPAAGVDLSNPDHAILASGDKLFDLPDTIKVTLLNNMSDAHKASLIPSQKAALNFEGYVVECRGDVEAPDPEPEDCERVQFEIEGTVIVRSIVPSKLRWYAVPRGRGFSGVVRGALLYTELITLVPDPQAQRCATRANAERHWLETYYAGKCAKMFVVENQIVMKAMLPGRPVPVGV